MKKMIILFALLVPLSGWAKPFCFGAVGKQCATPDAVKGKKLSPLNMVACSKVEKGQATCWTSPGSIEHDNCCAKYPNGVFCTSETQNDGHCAKEWADAYADITSRMAWYHIYDTRKSADMKLVSSPRMKKFGGKEAKATADLCAPGGTKLSARYDSGFCCSGKASRQKEMLICTKEKENIAAKTAVSPAAQKKVASLQKKSDDFAMKAKNLAQKIADLLKHFKAPAGTPEAKKGNPKLPEMSAQQMADMKKMEREEKQYEQKAQELKQQAQAALPPPSSNQPVQKWTVSAPPPPLPSLPKSASPKPASHPSFFDFGLNKEPAALPPPPESSPSEPPQQEEKPVAHEPTPPQPEPEAEQIPHCEGNSAWSPTFHRCVEAQAEQQAPPPDCGAGQHWSPTLQSCQSD